MVVAPNEDDLSYSTWTIFPDNLKMMKARQIVSSTKPFEQDERTLSPLPS